MEVSLCIFFYSLIFNLLGRQRQRTTIHVFTHPNACNTLGLGQAKTRSLEVNLGLPCGCQGPRCLGHHPLPCGLCIRRKLDGEQSQDSNASTPKMGRRRPKGCAKCLTQQTWWTQTCKALSKFLSFVILSERWKAAS